MTCEVAVANRMAVALAADSAVTFTGQAEDGSRRVAYASGANKIFQLSNSAPVGVMIFNNAELQEIPWELIIKTFRTHLAADQKDHLQDYVPALSEYIQGNRDLFPDTHRETHFKGLAARAFLRIFETVMRNEDGLRPDAAADQFGTILTAAVAKLRGILEGSKLADLFTAGEVAATVERYRTWLADEIRIYVGEEQSHLVDALPADDFATLAIQWVYYDFETIFNGAYTGVVIAGYGNSEVFPAVSELRFYGFILDKLVFTHSSGTQIDHKNSSYIQPYATKAMVDTFLNGFASEVWSAVNGAFAKHSKNLAEGLVTAGANVPDLEQHLNQAQEAFSLQWSRQVYNSHRVPLTDVVASLPPDHMAELAETLVMLESFKEKVTQRTQSVGGPIDVAVITKSEGLVWIKRKHYFSPELNHRYFARQSLTK